MSRRRKFRREQVADIPLQRGVLAETDKAWLCEGGVWWPKSQATLVGGQTVVTDWVFARKRKELVSRGLL